MILLNKEITIFLVIICNKLCHKIKHKQLRFMKMFKMKKNLFRVVKNVLIKKI